MSEPILFLVGFIVIALIFDYINGFHDAANSIATIVSTQVLSPGMAVMWAAFFNFVAFLVFGTHVAKTIGEDLVNISLVPEAFAHARLWVLMSGVLGAIVWNLITWYYGLPSSSSHALIGGYAGAALVSVGGYENGLFIAHGWIKTLAFIVVSPFIGFVLGFGFMVLIIWIYHKKNPDKVDRQFRHGQLISAALFSLGHGGNDAQKTMGIIMAALIATNHLPATADVPFWVVIACHAAIGLGTLSGGWRIVYTMGSRLTKLKPIGGFAAEISGAISLIGATMGGIPVSTTHTINGAIVGVGATRRLTAVRWGVAGSVVWAWILTIPISGVIAGLCFLIISGIHSVLS